MQLDEKPVLLVVGHQCSTVAEQAAAIAGVHAVWFVDNSCYAHQLAENMTELIVALSSSFSAIVAPCFYLW